MKLPLHHFPTKGDLLQGSPFFPDSLDAQPNLKSQPLPQANQHRTLNLELPIGSLLLSTSWAGFLGLLQPSTLNAWLKTIYLFFLSNGD